MKINISSKAVLLTGRDKAVYEYTSRDYEHLANDYLSIAKREKAQRWELDRLSHKIKRYEMFDTALDAWKTEGAWNA